MPVLSANQAAIVSSCASAVQAALKDATIRRVIFFDNHVVKFNQEDILNEGDTQAFVYEAFQSSQAQNVPRVPKVYDCFSWDGVQYLVMERIHLPTVETWIKDAGTEAEAQSRFDVACQAVANALRPLFALSPPANAEIGLIEGAYARTQSAKVRARSGRTCHPFFGGFNAPFRYTDAAALQRHINKALRTYRPRSVPLLQLEISSEPLVMVQGDIKTCNFLIDPETLQVTLIDFGDVSALPRSFVSFTLHSTTSKFVRGIAKCLGLERSDDSSVMRAATRLFWQTSGANRCGLDKNGFPVQKIKSLVPPLWEPSVKV